MNHCFLIIFSYQFPETAYPKYGELDNATIREWCEKVSRSQHTKNVCEGRIFLENVHNFSPIIFSFRWLPHRLPFLQHQPLWRLDKDRKLVNWIPRTSSQSVYHRAHRRVISYHHRSMHRTSKHRQRHQKISTLSLKLISIILITKHPQHSNQH